MVPLTQLWLPIVVSAVFVFVASSLIHMVLPYHRSDYGKLPEEDGFMDALRKAGVPSGDYLFPCPSSPRQMKEPAFQEKFKKGPVGFLTVMASGQASMAKNLVEWFIYCVVVGVFAGYIAGRALQTGSPYLSVFRFAGATAFIGYSLALWQNTIWYRRAWTTTAKSTLDGLVYGLLTAGVFGWLWPK
jgi:Flp pilus assembly protein TadB